MSSAERSFYIDYDSNSFIKDGKTFRYVSGSIHPYRVPREYWQDRLNKIWASGLNAIEVYIYWNEHEPKPGVYDFSGQNDIFHFISQAQKTGFLVILRAGPYICAEHEFGGLPWWLLSDGVDVIIPRSSETLYMNAVTRWLKEFLPRVVPYLYRNEGPIITVQVENEYGSYSLCDRVYTSYLRDIFREYLGDETLLFTTDGGSLGYLSCGVIDGVYATVDFGPGTNVTDSFDAQRTYEPSGPLVNSEYYAGWLDLWGHQHSKRGASGIIKTFEEMMDMNASVNFYMYHGGTNFGFSNGADPQYSTTPTSYDYDAPISEAGDITEKYMRMRDSISKYLPIPKVRVPANQTKMAYGKIPMKWNGTLVDAIKKLSVTWKMNETPLTFEKLGQGYGFIMYSTTLKDLNVNGKNLSISGIRDRGYILIGNNPIGIVYRGENTSLIINLPKNNESTLNIIVENMGRLNYGGDLLDNKGIVSDVTLNGEILLNWNHTLTENFIPNFQGNNFFKHLQKPKKNKDGIINFRGPNVYIGEFNVDKIAHSTFLDMRKFTKGVALIGNGNKLSNLGRYWPNKGPQVTLYTPGAFLHKNSKNQIILIEFEGSLCEYDEDCYVEFLDYPVIDNLKSDIYPAVDTNLRN